MKIEITSTSIARNSLWSRGKLGPFLTQVRNKLVNGQQDLSGSIRVTTKAFRHLFQASAALIMHGNRHQYYIHEADFTHGRFMERECVGTRDFGWDRFDEFFSADLEQTGFVPEVFSRVEVPTRGIYIPNVNADLVLVINRDGDVVKKYVDAAAIKPFICDRDFQRQGSLMLIPLLTGPKKNGNRALAYLYSPKVKHFPPPEAGQVAFQLAETVTPLLLAFFPRI